MRKKRKVKKNNHLQFIYTHILCVYLSVLITNPAIWIKRRLASSQADAKYFIIIITVIVCAHLALIKIISAMIIAHRPHPLAKFPFMTIKDFFHNFTTCYYYYYFQVSAPTFYKGNGLCDHNWFSFRTITYIN